MIYRILVTGSRSWKDTEKLHAALDAVALAALDTVASSVVLVLGGALGADTTAHLWAADRKRQGWRIERPEVHPVSGAEWRKSSYAGNLRNQRMVDLGADVCVAAVNPCEKPKCRKPKPHGTHGSTDCVERCEAYGIRVIPVAPGAGA